MSSQLQDILDQLNKLPPSERSAAAKRACADDLPLLAAVLEALPREPDSGELPKSAGPAPYAQTTASTALTNTPKPITPSSEPARTPTTAVPTRVGTIDLIEEIGRGGMGVVWRGRDTLLGREVAVKLLGLGKPSREALCEGVRGIIDIEHPGLVRVYSAGQHDELVYVVMELIEGESLASVLHRVGKLDAPAARQIMIQVCEAVGALHSRGVIHRDIKPGNIMLSRDGRVLVTDFGLASERPYGTIGGNAAVSAFTAGTPAYMAPEMFEGLVTARTDVYALGVTLFEMLTGRTPFDGPFAALRDAHAAREVPLFELRESQPQLAEIIERAMQKDPLFRYKTGERLGDAIRLASRDVASVAIRSLISDESSPRVHDKTPSTIGTTDELLARKREKAKVAPALSAVHSAEINPVVVAERHDDLPLVEPNCVDCGYSLSGLGLEGDCPECGLRFSQSNKLSQLERLRADDLNGLAQAAHGLVIPALLTGVIFLIAFLSETYWSPNQLRRYLLLGSAIPACFWLLVVTRNLRISRGGGRVFNKKSRFIAVWVPGIAFTCVGAMFVAPALGMASDVVAGVGLFVAFAAMYAPAAWLLTEGFNLEFDAIVERESLARLGRAMDHREEQRGASIGSRRRRHLAYLLYTILGMILAFHVYAVVMRVVQGEVKLLYLFRSTINYPPYFAVIGVHMFSQAAWKAGWVFRALALRRSRHPRRPLVPVDRSQSVFRGWPERCANCGYDRSGIGKLANCPECGELATAIGGFVLDGESAADLARFRKQFEAFAAGIWLLPILGIIACLSIDWTSLRPMDVAGQSFVAAVAIALIAARVVGFIVLRNPVCQRLHGLSELPAQVRMEGGVTYGLAASSLVATVMGSRIGGAALLLSYVTLYASTIWFARKLLPSKRNASDNERLRYQALQHDFVECDRRRHTDLARDWWWFRHLGPVACLFQIILVFAAAALLNRRGEAGDGYLLALTSFLPLSLVLFAPATLMLWRVIPAFEAYRIKSAVRGRAASHISATD